MLQLFTHRYLYEDVPDVVDHPPSNSRRSSSAKVNMSSPDLESIYPLRIGMDRSVNNVDSSDSIAPPHTMETPKTSAPDDEEEEDILGVNYALFWLSVITVFISILSDALSETIESAGVSYGVSGVFLSTIVLPIVGNAAEHASAVIFGMKNKLDLSMGIAVGSACQISIFVIPLMVVVGWMIGKDMSLNFGLFESFTMFLTVAVVVFSIKDGTANYFSGLLLIVAYLIIAAAFMTRNDQSLSSSS